MKDNEQRIYARVATTFRVRVATKRGIFKAYKAADISKGGLFLLSATPFQVGEQLEMFLQLPQQDAEIAVIGEVVRTIGYDQPPEAPPGEPYNRRGVGIRFVIVEPAQKSLLEEFVEKLLSEAGGGDRAHPRLKVQRPVLIEHAQHKSAAILKNVSLGGLYIETDIAMEVGAACKIMLSAGGPDPLPLTCQVVHIAPPLKGGKNRRWGIGMKYTALDPATRQHLARWIQEQFTSP